MAALPWRNTVGLKSAHGTHVAGVRNALVSDCPLRVVYAWPRMAVLLRGNMIGQHYAS